MLDPPARFPGGRRPHNPYRWGRRHRLGDRAGAGLLRRKAAIWPDGLDNIRILWSHGFANIPAGIQDAVLEQAETQYHAITAVASRSAGGESITFSAQASLGVTQRWSDAVSRYSIGGGEDL